MWTSAPVTDSRTMAAYPEIAVNDDGVVAVLFIDYDSAAPTDFRHRLALSADDGATWMTSTLQTLRPEELANKPDEIIDLWGDYEGLTSHGSTFYGVFAGESIDRKIRNLDPIFFKLDAHRHHETSEPAAPPSPRPAPRPTATYTVVRGDSLWRIARARTREGHKWTEIYSRNRATIKNPHRIYPEQSLAMPW